MDASCWVPERALGVKIERGEEEAREKLRGAWTRVRPQLICMVAGFGHAMRRASRGAPRGSRSAYGLRQRLAIERQRVSNKRESVDEN